MGHPNLQASCSQCHVQIHFSTCGNIVHIMCTYVHGERPTCSYNVSSSATWCIKYALVHMCTCMVPCSQIVLRSAMWYMVSGAARFWYVQLCCSTFCYTMYGAFYVEPGAATNASQLTGLFRTELTFLSVSSYLLRALVSLHNSSHE